MRKGYPILCFAVLAAAVTTAAPTAASPCEAALREGFANPPPDVKIGCYYYWVNERVDEEGVRKDLQWMKENGITRAFLATARASALRSNRFSKSFSPTAELKRGTPFLADELQNSQVRPRHIRRG